MREVIEVNGKNWRTEHKKILDIIHKREEEIAYKYGTMIVTEVWLQSIYQLMQEEKLPLLIYKGTNKQL